MTTDLGLYLPVIRVQKDLIRLFERHVAIHAVTKNLRTHRRVSPAALYAVARQAMLGERRHVALRFMDIVAGGTRHAAGSEATTAAELLHLVSMNVGRGVWGVVR